MKQISNVLNQSISSFEKLLKLIWFGQFFSLGIYVFIGFKRASEMGSKALEVSSVAPIFGFFGVVVLLVSFGLRWFTFSPKALAKICSSGLPKWISFISTQISMNPVTFNEQTHSELNEAERNLFEYARKLFPIFLIQWGCAHTAALYGMIIPSPQPLGVIVGASATAIAMFFHFPNIKTRFSQGLELAEFERGMNRNPHT